MPLPRGQSEPNIAKESRSGRLGWKGGTMTPFAFEMGIREAFLTLLSNFAVSEKKEGDAMPFGLVVF